MWFIEVLLTNWFHLFVQCSAVMQVTRPLSSCEMGGGHAKPAQTDLMVQCETVVQGKMKCLMAKKKVLLLSVLQWSTNIAVLDDSNTTDMWHIQFFCGFFFCLPRYEAAANVILKIFHAKHFFRSLISSTTGDAQVLQVYLDSKTLEFSAT